MDLDDSGIYILSPSKIDDFFLWIFISPLISNSSSYNFMLLIIDFPGGSVMSFYKKAVTHFAAEHWNEWAVSKTG